MVSTLEFRILFRVVDVGVLLRNSFLVCVEVEEALSAEDALTPAAHP